MHLQALLQAYLVEGHHLATYPPPRCPWSLTQKQLLMGNFDDLKVIQFILLDSTGNNACLPHSRNYLERKVKEFIK